LYTAALTDTFETTLSWLQPRMSMEADVSRIINLLESVFTFIRPSEVKAVLSDKAYLLPLLFEVREHLLGYFGQYAPLSLKVVSDSGSAEDSQLFILVGTAMSPQAAFNALSRFDKNWWLDAGIQARGYLEVDVVFS
jgi:hypothetical protein